MAVLGITVGVGWAHEDLYRRGITEVAVSWLCERLPVPAEWWVEATTTTILCTGDDATLRDTVRQLASRLGSGPDTLPQAKLITGGDRDVDLLFQRFGYRGFGLAGATRYGFRTVAADDVSGWLAQLGNQSARLFSNAEGFDPTSTDAAPLELSDVVPLARPTRTPVVVPGQAAVGRGFGVGLLAPTDPTSALAAEILAVALGAVIPDPVPGTPGVAVHARPLGSDQLHWSLLAADNDVPAEVIGRAVAELNRLRHAGPSELEILDALPRFERRWSRTDLLHMVHLTRLELWRAAGYPPPPAVELDASADALASRIRELLGTALVLHPGGVPGLEDWPVMHELDPAEPATGTTYPPVKEVVSSGGFPAENAMITGSDRLTSVGNPLITVTRDSVAVVEHRPHGERVLRDVGGHTVVIDPLVWKRSDGLIGWVDQNLPHHLDIEEPVPVSPYVVRVAARARPAAFLVLFVLVGTLAGVFLIAAVAGPDQRVATFLFGAFFVGMFAYLWRIHGRVRGFRRRAVQAAGRAQGG